MEALLVLNTFRNVDQILEDCGGSAIAYSCSAKLNVPDRPGLGEHAHLILLRGFLAGHATTIVVLYALHIVRVYHLPRTHLIRLLQCVACQVQYLGVGVDKTLVLDDNNACEGVVQDQPVVLSGLLSGPLGQRVLGDLPTDAAEANWLAGIVEDWNAA